MVAEQDVEMRSSDCEVGGERGQERKEKRRVVKRREGADVGDGDGDRERGRRRSEVLASSRHRCYGGISRALRLR